jgi:hypothetical protein
VDPLAVSAFAAPIGVVGAELPAAALADGAAAGVVAGDATATGAATSAVAVAFGCKAGDRSTLAQPAAIASAPHATALASSFIRLSSNC